MNLIGEVAKKVIPWAKIGSIAMTAIGAAITAVAQRRNQEILIEKVGEKVAKEVIKNQNKMMKS